MCIACGGILKTTTVSFGQGLPPETIGRALELHASARLCLVIGSSLGVYPAATLPELTLQAGGQLAIVNLSETHLDGRAIFVAREPAAELFGRVRV
jgi:NAD-dependent deacetylase